MAGQRVGVEVEDEAVREALKRLVTTIAAPRKAMDQIGSHLVAATLRRFETETAPDGKPWLKSARALAVGGQTLTKSGRLRGSITHNVAADGRAVEVGSNVIYAAIHQFGGGIKQGARTQILAFAARGGRFTSRAKAARRRGGAVRVSFAEIGAREFDMPARPYLGIDERNRVAILGIVSRALAQAATP